MTLEDFFTLSEMNSGLTSPSRVRELITVMQNQRDSTVKNAGDFTRQRSAVVSALATTENKDCVDLFIQLDGLHFISSWLKDAKKFGNDSSDSFVEEYIFHLLKALEKLHLDYEKSLAFEIRTTVEILVEHRSSKVQDKARVLLESWNAEKCSTDVSLSDDKPRETSDNADGRELARDDQVGCTSLDAVHPEQVESTLEPNKISDPATEDEKPVDHVSSSSSASLAKPAIEPSVHDSPGHYIIYTNSDIHGLKSNASEGQPFTSSSDAVAVMEDVAEQMSQINSNAESKNLCAEDSSKVELRAVESDGKSGGDVNSCRNSKANAPKERSDVNGHVSPKSVNGEKSWGNFLSGIKDSLSNEDLTNDYAFGKKQIDLESNTTAQKQVDYGVVDPLEVAMHVAMEVERETVDCRQQSCSTSPKEVTENQPNSPVSGKQSPTDLSGKSNSSNESSNGSESISPQEIATSEAAETAQEEETNAVKSPCNFFDLNEEIFSEDLIQPSAPVSVVSASRASAADPRLPCVPLQFEGNLGWKGSALTSAFRRVPESDFSTGGSSNNNSKQRQGLCLDFDLNMTENVDELSVETNSKRSELDLNCITGDGRSHHLDWRIGNNWSQFPASNHQPTRNIDLNDGPLFLTPKKAMPQNDSTISIMGTRVEVNRKDSASQTSNSGKMGNFMGVGSAVPYVHSLNYGYGGNFASGPAMPFSGPMFGPARPIPYMVDSPGMPVIPHTASASGLPFAQQPFVVGSMPSNGGSFDLNSGMLWEGGNKDSAGLGLFLNSAHGPGLQPTMSSGVVGKRKEPEGGYSDHYYPAKHYTPPPWKQS